MALTSSPGRPRPRRVRALAAGAAALAAVGLATVVVTEANAEGTCSVQYQNQSDWGTGATVNLTITNNGPAITSWTVGFSFAGNQKVTNGWNGDYSQSGSDVTVKSQGYNGSLATGAATSSGFNLSYSGANVSPTTFTLNGTVCGGGTTPPTTTTTPPTTTTGTPPADGHVANPFVGAAAYLNPDYVKEIQAQATADGSAAEAAVAKYQTGIWMDKKAAIAGDSS